MPASRSVTLLRLVAALVTAGALLAAGATAARGHEPGSDRGAQGSGRWLHLGADLGRGAATSLGLQPHPAAEPYETPWRWPLPGEPRVVRGFEPPEQRWLRGHRGVDLAGAVGHPVSAVADGVVSHSGVIDGVGTVTVRHGPDLRSTYQPLDHRVEVGTVVSQGDQIGVLDAGGHCALHTCLHLGAIADRDRYVDPLLFLLPWQVSLLPLGD